MTVTHAGGLTALKKIADFAALYHVRTGCHGATDLSPVCMAAALHFGMAVHNFGIQEHMPHNAETDAVFPHGYAFDDGYMYPGDAPGLGVEIDEKLAARIPTSARICRSTESWMERCSTGEDFVCKKKPRRPENWSIRTFITVVLQQRLPPNPGACAILQRQMRRNQIPRAWAA